MILKNKLIGLSFIIGTNIIGLIIIHGWLNLINQITSHFTTSGDVQKIVDGLFIASLILASFLFFWHEMTHAEKE